MNLSSDFNVEGPVSNIWVFWQEHQQFPSIVALGFKQMNSHCYTPFLQSTFLNYFRSIAKIISNDRFSEVPCWRVYHTFLFLRGWFLSSSRPKLSQKSVVLTFDQLTICRDWIVLGVEGQAGLLYQLQPPQNSSAVEDSWETLWSEIKSRPKKCPSIGFSTAHSNGRKMSPVPAVAGNVIPSNHVRSCSGFDPWSCNDVAMFIVYKYKCLQCTKLFMFWLP